MPACYKREWSTSRRASYFQIDGARVFAMKRDTDNRMRAIDFEVVGHEPTQWNDSNRDVSWQEFMTQQKVFIRAMRWAGL